MAVFITNAAACVTKTAAYVTNAAAGVTKTAVFVTLRAQSTELWRSRLPGAGSRERIGEKLGHGCVCKGKGRFDAAFSGLENRLKRAENFSYPLLLEYQVQH
jgi:hypothetical protein